MDDFVSRVRKFSATLLNPDAYPGEQRQASLDLFDAFAAVIDLDDNSPSEIDLQETWLEAGRAISPREAARCLREYARTAKFMQGVRLAVERARELFPEETVRVLYAGCGPFATLVLPLAHLWCAEDVRFTLVDIHKRSLDAARKIACRLGVENSIAAWVQADAANYHIKCDQRPHLLITETMQQALRDETQVAICKNLVPQLCPGGLLVPECIDLLATLINVDHEFGRKKTSQERMELGRVMRLDAATAGTKGECGHIRWPAQIPPRMNVFVRTHIRVFDNIVLGDRSCSLCLPMILSMPQGECSGRVLRFSYRLHPRPGLHSEWEDRSHMSSSN